MEEKINELMESLRLKSEELLVLLRVLHEINGHECWLYHDRIVGGMIRAEIYDEIVGWKEANK